MQFPESFPDFLEEIDTSVSSRMRNVLNAREFYEMQSSNCCSLELVAGVDPRRGRKMECFGV